MLKWNCAIILSASVAVVLSFVPNEAIAAGKTVKICNLTSEKITIAIGWMDWGFPVARGWYGFDPSECGRVSIAEADSYLPLFAYGVGASSGDDYRPNNPTKNNFCITRTDTFDAKSSALCQASDAIVKEVISDWEMFRALGNPIAEAYTWNIK